MNMFLGPVTGYAVAFGLMKLGIPEDSVRRVGGGEMGPIGCLAGLIAQIIHMVVMVVTLPITIICSIFGKKTNESEVGYGIILITFCQTWSFQLGHKHEKSIRISRLHAPMRAIR